MPVTGSDKWHMEAIGSDGWSFESAGGTYELCGPKIQGNPEGFEKHTLVRHGSVVRPMFPKEAISINHAASAIKLLRGLALARNHPLGAGRNCITHQAHVVALKE